MASFSKEQKFHEPSDNFAASAFSSGATLEWYDRSVMPASNMLDPTSKAYEFRKMVHLISQLDDTQAEAILLLRNPEVRYARCLAEVAYLLNKHASGLEIIDESPGRWALIPIAEFLQGKSPRDAIHDYMKHAERASVEAGIISETAHEALLSRQAPGERGSLSHRIWAIHVSAWATYQYNQSKGVDYPAHTETVDRMPQLVLEANPRVKAVELAHLRHPEESTLAKFGLYTEWGAAYYQAEGAGFAQLAQQYVNNAVWYGATHGILSEENLRRLKLLLGIGEKIQFLRSFWEEEAVERGLIQEA